MKTTRKTFRIPGLFLLASLFLANCGERYSPWETDVPSDMQNLTAEQISRLNEMPEQELPFTIAVMGDPQGSPGDFAETVDIINRRDDVKFIMVLGDLTDYGLMHEYIWAGDALKRSNVPFFTAVGNHDSIAHGKKIYQNMFGPFNYTFEYGGLKFAMWNNNQFEFGPTDFGWLQQNADSRTVVGSHVPPQVDMHTQPQIDLWVGINDRASIVASLHGHRGTKVDQRWVTDGIPYYIVAKLDGRRYTLVTFHKDRSVTFQNCRNDCGPLLTDTEN